jgi:predicted secreted protein
VIVSTHLLEIKSDKYTLTEIKLTKDDNGKTVETRVGESGVIELPENSTTGGGGVWTLNVKEETGTASLSNSRYTAPKQSGIGGSSLWISRLKYCISCYDD